MFRRSERTYSDCLFVSFYFIVMKLFIYGFFMAWGMFLAIPCPFRRWDEAARGRMLGFLPLIGLIVGAIWLRPLVLHGSQFTLCRRALILCALPWLVTGFLHLDGFMDVCDAVLSAARS